MESKQGYYGQYENGKSLYRFQYGEESESPGYDIIPSDRCMFQSLWLLSTSLGPLVILLLLGLLLRLGPKFITLRTFITFRAKTCYSYNLYYI